MTCLGQLLTSHPNFNFRSNVLKIVVERAGTPNPALRNACVTALRQLFKGDQQGEVSLEAVTMIAKTVKEKKYEGLGGGGWEGVEGGGKGEGADPSTPPPPPTPRYPAASEVIRTFTALPLRIHEDDVAAGGAEPLNLHEDGRGKGKGKGKGKGRKSADGVDEEDDGVKADMDEAKGSIDAGLLARCQRQTLQVRGVAWSTRWRLPSV